MRRPRVLMVVGYFDWFSGYQETALAEAFAPVADTEVVASDRVSPAFSDDHLRQLGVPRRYSCGSRREKGVLVTRLPCREVRSMVWSTQARRYLASRPADLVVQVMPGQLLPVAPTLTANPAHRVALYGDNRAMWADLSRPQRWLKWAAFSVTKGVAYTVVNRRCRRIFGYTPNTLRRLRAFRAGRDMELMPPAYSAERFFLDEKLRRKARYELGYQDSDLVILGVGKFDQRKRLDWLLAAFEATAPHHPWVRLLLVGADDLGTSRTLRRSVENSPHRSRIRVQAFVEPARLNEFFNTADVAVWPRSPAITIQQAMGTGLFVLLPDNDLVGHLLRDGSGRLYRAQSGHEVASLSGALTEVVDGCNITPSGRRQRALANRWLAADAAVATLLTAVET